MVSEHTLKMKFFTKFLLVVTVAAMSASPLFAWDETGHKISAYIAWERMTPAVRERVIKILREAPEDSHLSALYASYGSQSIDTRKREFFMVASTWADMVRDRDFANRYRKYHKGNWHYDDTFWTLRDGKIIDLPRPDDGGQALARINEYASMIRGNATDAQKAVAIAWLEHLIGDIHQPLHTSARVTEREPKGDQGGNTFLLTPEGTARDNQVNLHWFWDSIVGRNAPNSGNEGDTTYIAPMARKMMSDYPYSRMQGRLNLSDSAAWAKESLTLAQTDVFSADLVRFQLPSSKYRKNAYRVARQRLAMAGYRMGDLFNQAFSTP